jgi:hypothetical protein
MASYTITTAVNYTSLTGRTGSDTYNINGGSLTFDTDTRYCQNATPSTGVLGNVTMSSTLGGTVQIDGTNIYQVLISGGTGTIPAAGTVITQGANTAEIMCVMSNHYGGTIATTGAWVSGQWVKIRGGANLAAGVATYSGGSITLSAAPIRSWIEIVGVESLTLTVNRLNSLTMNGDWWYVKDATGAPILTTGVAGESYQLPYIAAHVWYDYPGVEVETGAGTGVYELWPNASYKFSNTNLSTDSRCKFVRITSTGALTFGKDAASNNAGMVAPVGARVRIPNIICSNCNGTSGYGVNVMPNATMGTRYEIAANSSGVVNLQKVTGPWYFNIQQPYSVYIKDLHTCEQFVLAEPSTPAYIENLMVGMSNQVSPYSSNSIVFQQCMNGGTAINLVGVRAEQITTSGYSIYFVNLYGGWTLSKIKGMYASTATALAGPVFFNTCDNFTVTDLYLVGKRLIMSACTNWTVTNVYYADNPSGTTSNSVSTQAVELMANCKTGVLTNVANWPGVADCHPLGGWVYMNTCFDILVTGIGTSSNPAQGGSTAGFRTGYLFSDGGINKNIKFQRNWCQNLRLNLYSGTNTTQSVRFQNCYNVDATLTSAPQWYNSTSRGNRHNAGTVSTGYTHVDGMHFWDAFTGDTTTRFTIAMTEKSLSTQSAYTIDAGTPKFTSTGTLVMANLGDQITWTTGYYMLGWTGLSTFSVTGANSGNHTLWYDIDKGSGFSGTFKSLTNANLAAETGISPTTGIKFKVRAICSVANTANTLTSIVINGTTTLATQNAALYPLDTIGLTLSNIQPGSDVVVYQSGTTNVLDTGDSVGTTSYTYQYSTLQNVDIGVFLSGFRPYYIRNYLLTSSPATLPVAQMADMNYA